MTNEFVGKPITDSIAREVSIHAMLSSNCYHDEDSHFFDVEKLGWTTIDQKEYFDGLAYDIYRHSSSGKIIWAFRGTDSIIDHVTANFSIIPFFNQYSKANRLFSKYLKKYGNSNIEVCGHSLGGGLALSMSVRHGIPAYTFDSSPRIFDGLGDKHKGAKRLVVYEDGETLQWVRSWYPKIKEVVPESAIYKCGFNFGGCQHSIEKLARELLHLGAKTSDKLKMLI